MKIRARSVPFLLFLIVPGAIATTIVPKTFSEICREADMIFVGKVEKVEPRWTDSTRNAIETLVTFRIEEAVHGLRGERIVLTFAGGEVEGVRETVNSMPRFAVGDRAVLFAHAARLVSPIVGFHQGCFPIVERPGGAVVTSAEGHPMVVESGIVRPAHSHSIDEALPLATFLDFVRAQLRDAQ